MQNPARITALFMLFSVSAALAETGSIDTTKAPASQNNNTQAAIIINEPADGAVLTSYQPVKINYRVTPGPKGDHAHLYIDKFRVAMLHQAAGEHEIKMLHPGMHKIRIEIVTKDHQHIGVGKEITVDAR